MTRSRLLFLLALVLTAVGLVGHAQAPAAPAMPKIEFEKFTLPNGLQVILHVDRKLPIVHVNEWFHVGSKNEQPGRTGFAHLFEHMMFQGSKNATGETTSCTSRRPAPTSAKAASTARPTTTARTTSPRCRRATSRTCSGWNPIASPRSLDATDQKKLDNQRDVVKNERRQGLENTPYGRAFSLMFEAVFPTGHPYSWPVIGSQEDLTAASLDDVKEFFRQYYSPSNLSLVIAGDFDPAEAKRLVTEVLRRHPARPRARPSGAAGCRRSTAENVVEVSDRVSLERVYIGWPTPEYFAPDDAALDIAARILADGLSSRLNKALVYDQQLATAVAVVQRHGRDRQRVRRAGHRAAGRAALGDRARSSTAEIARLAKEGPTAAELERAKTKQESEFISGLERIGGFGGKADVLNQYNVFLGDPGKVDADLQRYRALTPADVQQAVARWLDTPNRAIIRFHPEKSERPAERDDVRSDRDAAARHRPSVHGARPRRRRSSPTASR